MAPRRLPDILRALHPWLRTRVSAITIWPRADGGWEAQLSYLDYTTAPPPDCRIPAGDAAHPMDTHHPLALGQDPEVELAEQLREMQAGGEFGEVHLAPFSHSAMTSGSPGGSPDAPRTGRIGWVISTHAGSALEQQEWRRRVGQKPLPGAKG